ncbi:Putative Transaldolase [Aspergillus calidoustus]|uniref:Transaldolase n=1 Tax=Aspergillus calidoustus TaxID=454130 RepID=A0A0U5FXF7_ASPCI|nr:Putative Transaldolase [Aspergillus calidoustus]
MASPTGLDILRKRTTVDCDTMDEQIAKTLGPFQDCTSNQAIAFGELSKPEHADLIRSSVTDAEALSPRFQGVDTAQLAVEIAMVKLALKIAPHIRGYVHIQTNPYESYSTERTVANAFRVVEIFRHLNPAFDTTRICIKIPSTWEGLMACRTLELAGVRTLATTLFTFVQAVLAAEVGCTYIAPYVNQLKVHFEPGFVDPGKLLPLCVSLQKFYESIGAKTQVLPASLTSTDEIYALAGVHHITISPGLLQQLSQPGFTSQTKSLFDADFPKPEAQTSYANRESVYRLEFSRAERGASEEKLTQAINIFCEMQDDLIALMGGKRL